MRAYNRSNKSQVSLANVLHEILSYYMHRYIIINHDLGLHLVIHSEDEDLNLVDVIDEMIVKQLCDATEGIQKT